MVTSYWREDTYLLMFGERRYMVTSYWREKIHGYQCLREKIHGYQLLEKSNRITTFWVEKSAS